MFWKKKKTESTGEVPIDEGTIEDDSKEEFPTLESTLQGIFRSQGLQYSILNSNNEKINSSCYTLPFEMRMQRIFVDVMLNGMPVTKELGFKFNDRYFHLDSDLKIANGSLDSDNAIYIPLIETTYKQNIGKNKGNKFIPNDDSPYILVGPRGLPENDPLVLITALNKEGKGAGLYLENGRLSSYNFKGIAETIKHFVTAFNSSKEDKLIVEEKTANVPEVIIKSDKKKKKFNWNNPESIVDYLDEYVVGQEEAKKQISVVFSNYMLRIETKDDELLKENMMLVGPSGCGKTFMISLLARKAQIPYLETKLSGKSTSGLVGENLSNIFSYLRQKVDEPCPYAVVFLDEMDKLCADGGTTSTMGARLQNEIVGWLEEADVGVEYEGSRKNSWGILNTRNILFVAAGAFYANRGGDNALTDIISKRMNGGLYQGKDKDDYDILSKVMPEDMIKYGLTPELVGRIPLIMPLHSLSIDDKIRILLESKESPMAKYAKILQHRGYNLEVDESIARAVAENCPYETGARALSQMTSRMFSKILYSPDRYINGSGKRTIHISREIVYDLLSS